MIEPGLDMDAGMLNGVLAVLSKLSKEENDAVGDLEALADEVINRFAHSVSETKDALIELMEEALSVVSAPSESVLDMVDTVYAENGIANLVKAEEIAMDKGFLGWLPLLSEEEEGAEKKVEKRRFAMWSGEVSELEVDVLLHSTSSLGSYWPGHTSEEGRRLQVAAGPRMRKECIQIMESRGNDDLKAGLSAPIITQGYRLAARHVAHLVSPESDENSMTRKLTTTSSEKENTIEGKEKEQKCISRRKRPRPAETQILKTSFENGLDAAQALAARSVGLLCQESTSFPVLATRDAALEAVCDWFRLNDTKTSIEVIIFLVPPKRIDIYTSLATELVACRVTNRFISIAQHWLRQSNRLLIIAGPSATEPRPVDAHLFDEDESQSHLFTRAYPWLAELGYKSHADCEQGLAQDRLVSDDLKRAYMVERSARMLSESPPLAVTALKQNLSGHNSVFVYALTPDNAFAKGSNNQFETSPWHFYAGAVGDWCLQQCEVPCSLDAFWDARPEIDDMRPHLPRIPDHKMTVCDGCEAKFLPNVRALAADAFSHTAHDAHQDELIEWLDSNEDFLILELRSNDRATRRFVESLLDDKPKAKLIRLHPSHYQLPAHLMQEQRALPLGFDFNLEAIDTLFENESTTESQPKASKHNEHAATTVLNLSTFHKEDDVYQAALLSTDQDEKILRDLYWRDHLRALRLPPPFLDDNRRLHTNPAAAAPASTQQNDTPNSRASS